jgi:hypothetical protein
MIILQWVFFVFLIISLYFSIKEAFEHLRKKSCDSEKLELGVSKGVDLGRVDDSSGESLG